MMTLFGASGVIPVPHDDMPLAGAMANISSAWMPDDRLDVSPASVSS